MGGLDRLWCWALHTEMRGRHREGKQRRGQAHPLPEHPSEEGSGRLDLLVGFGHQLHGLLLFAGVVHREPGLPLAERREENRPMFRSGRRGARRGEERRWGRRLFCWWCCGALLLRREGEGHFSVSVAICWTEKEWQLPRKNGLAFV